MSDVISDLIRITGADKMEIRSAIIKSAEITADDGALTAWIQLDYGGLCQGFGGHALYLPKTFTHHELKSVAGHFIFRVMEVAGVHKWAQLPGKAIRAKGNGSGIDSIGHIIKDDWFCPKQDFTE